MKKYIFFLMAVALVLVPACDDNDDEYTVIFNSNGGSVVSSQTIKSGGKIAKPQDPIYRGYTFDVWYKEERSTTEWRFETDVVTDNITLYANWDLGQITNPVVENLPGGARISYTFPDDVDFFYVKAEYYINGMKFISNASFYVNSVEVKGFGTTDEQTVLLYCGDRSGNYSEPVPVKIHPTTPPVVLIRESMTMSATFGGVCIQWKNEHRAPVTINLLAANENGDLVLLETIDTNEAEGEYCLRGFDSTERLFGAFVRDLWDNHSDTLLGVFTPL